MDRKVLLIGWDGADWKVITPLLDAGKMPHLERLVNRGVMGDLRTLEPVLSPLLWTTIATGKRPYKHGVLGFTEPDPHTGGIRPVTSLSRRTRALWNMFHLEGMHSNILGWWPSHPVEPIRGVMVSNHYHHVPPGDEGHRPLGPGTVHPERLLEPLSELRLHPSEIGPEPIAAFVPGILELEPEKEPLLQILAKTFCECTTMHAAATAVIRDEPWDFMAVYYDAIDHLSHAFMNYHPPRIQGVGDREFELYRGVVETGYRYHDLMLGVLLELAGEETTVVLVSDHGFHPDHLRPLRIPRVPAGPAAQHREHGILVMAGAGLKQDERIYGASLLDIAPTILTLFGLPVGEDMDGTPLLGALLTPPEVETIPTWDDREGEDGGLPADLALDPLEARDAVRQLVALGYIDEPDEKVEKAVAGTMRELSFNEAVCYGDAGRHFDAAAILVWLSEEWPEDGRFLLRLVGCYQALGRMEDARRTIDDLLERRSVVAGRARQRLRALEAEQGEEPPEETGNERRRELARLRREASEDPYLEALLLGVQHLAEGDPARALGLLGDAAKARPGAVVAKVWMGEALLQLGEHDAAEDRFRGALSIDGSNVSAQLGLCDCLLAGRKNKEALEAALDAVGLDYHNPDAHYRLGVALHRVGRIPRAIEALEVCVRQSPNYAPAHERLATIYERRVGNPRLAAEYRERAREAKEQIRRLAEKDPGRGESRPRSEPMTSDDAGFQPGKDHTPEMQAPLEETIVVVTGLPRSGTSMMMQMLAAAGVPSFEDESRAADVHNERGYFEDERVKRLREESAWIGEARGRAVKVVAPLLRYLPRGEHHYRLIFMERDLTEIVASQKAMLADGGPREPGLPDDRLRRTFRKQLATIRRGIAVNQAAVLYVDHRQCIEDGSGVAARVNAFLGGALDERAMAEAVEPGLYRHRANRGGGSADRG